MITGENVSISTYLHINDGGNMHLVKAINKRKRDEGAGALAKGRSPDYRMILSPEKK